MENNLATDLDNTYHYLSPYKADTLFGNIPVSLQWLLDNDITPTWFENKNAKIAYEIAKVFKGKVVGSFGKIMGWAENIYYDSPIRFYFTKDNYRVSIIQDTIVLFQDGEPILTSIDTGEFWGKMQQLGIA